MKIFYKGKMIHPCGKGNLMQGKTSKSRLIAQYKVDNTLYDLIPEFNSEFTDYTYDDIVDGDVTTRTIYSNSLPTLMRFGVANAANDYSKSLLSILDMNTNNITTMRSMFDWCINLREVNTNNWNTSNVTNMQSMFCGCNNLTELDLSNFNTSNVTNMAQMINECYDLTELNISNWHLNSEVVVTDMFIECDQLTTLTMNNSDYNSVNKIITQLLTRTTDSMGTLDVTGIDDISQVDTITTQSKNWNIIYE